MKDILEQQYRQYASASQVDDDALAERIVTALPRREGVLLRLLRWMNRDVVAIAAIWVLMGMTSVMLVCYMVHGRQPMSLAVIVPLIFTGTAFAVSETVRAL